MPVDPRHGRFIPSGRDLAAALRQFLARLRGQTLLALRLTGAVPDLGPHPGALADVALPFLARYWAAGARETLARLARRGALPKKRAASLARKNGVNLPAPLSPPGALAPAGAAAPAGTLTLTVLEPLQQFPALAAAALRRQALAFAESTLRTAALEVRHAVEAVRRELAEGLAEGEANRELARRVHRVFSDPFRAARVAHTEASRARHAAQVEAARESGVVAGLRWAASSDACPLCLALDGKEVKLDEPFAVDPRGGPYATVMHPPRHPWCMCAAVEVLF